MVYERRGRHGKNGSRRISRPNKKISEVGNTISRANIKWL